MPEARGHSGSQGLAAVRGVVKWLRAEETRLDRDRMAGLERRIQELEGELRERGRAP
jgi:hypothetical protein